MIESRDIVDKNRSNSPLVIDKHAFVINTDNISQVINPCNIKFTFKQTKQIL